MVEDYGILITAPGSDVVGSPVTKEILNTSKPFIKIDTQNRVAFQTLTLLITTNPPEPTLPAFHRYTTLYQFPHGYKYVPSIESLFYVSTPPPSTFVTQTYFQDMGQIAGQTIADGAFLYAVADATNVYIICDKYNAGGGSANLLTGTNVQITIHVFVESVG
jgi:hypothetical protein